jgi:peptidoglycan/xylan/chitin deacetylase (PgdA/CDA1 family)
MKTRGAITLVFDDGYEHILRTIVPLLNKLNIPAVFAIPLDPKTDTMDGQKLAPISAWQAVANQGHEIAAHSISHKDLTLLTPSQLQVELTQPAKVLGATTLVYPGGAHDNAVVTAASQVYKAARTVKKGFETLPPPQPMRLKTYNFTRRNFSLYKANVLALWACLTNSWLIETYHIISSDNANSKYAVSQDEFLRHVTFIKKLPITIATIKDII